MYNYHLHSRFSFDSQEDVEQICKQAIQSGFHGICFTDHCDFGVPSGKDNLFDYDAYRKEISAMQQKYAGKLKIGCGIEMGLQIQELEKSRDYLEKHPFDFIMASCHYIDGQGVFKGTFCQEKTREEAFGRYFGRIYEMIQKFDNFHVLGHMDVIRRDDVFLKVPFHYAEFAPVIDDILNLLIARGQGIEINTAAPRYGLEGFHPHLSIVKRYRELGGTVITCGSDAHRKEHIAMGISEAYAMLKELGFSTISVFEAGKEVRIPL